MEFIISLNRIAGDLWVNIRRRIIFKDFNFSNKKILDLGCGSGYIGLHYLKNNEVYFLDSTQKNLNNLKIDDAKKILADVSRPIPYDNFFDVIFCADVLEHIKNDQAALKNIYRCLKFGGILILTLPAYSKLYGHHDRLIGHFRRYDKKSIKLISQDIGFKLLSSRYTMSLMFPFFLSNQLLVRSSAIYKGKSKLEKKIKPFLNFICWIESKIKLPFGIGLIMVFRK